MKVVDKLSTCDGRGREKIANNCKKFKNCRFFIENFSMKTSPTETSTKFVHKWVS